MLRMRTFGVCLFLLITLCNCYLEFKLVRMPHSQRAYDNGIPQCMSDLPQKKHKKQWENRLLQDDEEKDSEEEDDEERQQIEKKVVEDSDNFKQICFQKDMSYAIQLYNDKKQKMLLSMDLTVPVSWVKADKCFIASTRQQCSRVQEIFKEPIEKIARKIKHLFGKIKSSNKKHMNIGNSQYALIEGSSQVVKGQLQKTQTLQFTVIDTGRMLRAFDVLKLGLGVHGIQANLKFTNTTFISATQISPALNYLCDGAISLRFDQNSESSFLKQITKLAQSSETFVTIYIGDRTQSMTMGDVSVKNSAQGLSGVHWLEAQQHETHGKLPICSSIQLTNSNSESHKQISVESVPIVLTLSSSCITIPESLLLKMFDKFFKKASCSIDPVFRYVVCEQLSLQDIGTKQLNFVSGDSQIMIPFKELVVSSKRHKITFNLKASLDSRYIILGEPIFKRHFVVLDFQKNRIGFSAQRTKFPQQMISPVTLIRFVVWTFILGCFCLCFAYPVQQCYYRVAAYLVQNRKTIIKKKKSNAPEDTRHIYTRVEQDNGYDDLNGKMQEILHEEVQAI